MFRSVYAKYLTVCALVILISFLLLSAIVTSILSTYVAEQKSEEVEWAATSAAQTCTMLFTPARDVSATAPQPEQVANTLETYATRNFKVGLFYVDGEGTILVGTSSFASLAGQSVPTTCLVNLLQEPYLTVGTLSSLLSERSVICAAPVSADGETLSGAVFAVASVAGKSELIRFTNRTVTMTSLWVMLAALIAVSFMSDRIISPLRSMIGAAKSFARGKFDTRVEVSGQDEIAELAQAFNNMADSLDQLEKMRASFLANVSHDLRTPMTTISGFIEGITSGAIPPEKQEYYLGVINAEVHRLSRLVSQLLDVSRLESGDRKFHPGNFDVCELARLVLISFEQKIDAKNLNVDFACQEESLYAYADRDALHQVFYNLCENAIKFARDGGVLRISIYRTEHHKLQVQVYNEGNGIPAEDLPFIFDRFYKDDKSRGLDKVGVGLGLYIVKTIIDAHGETITVKSTEGEDCAFTFTVEEGVYGDEREHSKGTGHSAL